MNDSEREFNIEMNVNKEKSGKVKKEGEGGGEGGSERWKSYLNNDHVISFLLSLLYKRFPGAFCLFEIMNNFHCYSSFNFRECFFIWILNLLLFFPLFLSHSLCFLWFFMILTLSSCLSLSVYFHILLSSFSIIFPLKYANQSFPLLLTGSGYEWLSGQWTDIGIRQCERELQICSLCVWNGFGQIDLFSFSSISRQKKGRFILWLNCIH